MGTGTVLGRRRMPECMKEPKKYGQISDLITGPKAKGVKLFLFLLFFLSFVFFSSFSVYRCEKGKNSGSDEA